MRSFAWLAGALALIVPIDASSKCDGPGNNLQRCFIASSELASSFCSTYLGLGTVTRTSTPSASVTVPSLAATVVLTTFVTTVRTSGTVVTTTTVQTVVQTTTTTKTVPPVQRRAAATTLKCTTYAASSLSSVCSCLMIASTVITRTLPTNTATSYSPATTITTTTSTVESVSLVTSLDTATVSTTTTVTSTSTTTTAPQGCVPPQHIQASYGVSVCPIPYNKKFQGTGLRENPSNIDASSVPDTMYFPGTYDACQAVQACMDFIYNVPNNDFSFDVHYLIGTQRWECIGYFTGFDQGEAFNVVDSNVGAVYGYSYISQPVTLPFPACK